MERSAPTGWSVVDDLDTGGNTTTSTVYDRYFTGSVRDNQTYDVPAVSGGDQNRTARGSQWADERVNPPLPDTCGLNIGLLIDVSGSIASSLSQVKNAANGFVDALTGTPSTIGLATFATGAQTILPPTPVASAAGATTVKTAINGITAGGGTNWAAGLFEMTAAIPPFDVVVMLTDGSPTFYGSEPPGGPGNYTRFREVEEGIFSANALKAEGTRVVAVGVGSGVSGAAQNLQAVSGPVRGSDYVQTDYDALARVFRQVALATCSGTISVVKLGIPPGGSAADAQPPAGVDLHHLDVRGHPSFRGHRPDGGGQLRGGPRR
ncbi:vWA domain-containing protein [Luedemannella helvata]|uniref:vWA domain-containing protein n=1 Tax=Luedemannella helvata TaxID=349315 RepID=UPI0031DB7A99